MPEGLAVRCAETHTIAVISNVAWPGCEQAIAVVLYDCTYRESLIPSVVLAGLLRTCGPPASPSCGTMSSR